MKLKSLLLVLGVSTAPAAVWQTSGDGIWTGTGNWQNGNVPNAEGAVADFTSDGLTAAGTVTLDSDVILGTLKTGTATASDWTFTGSTITLNNGTEKAAIQVTSGTSATIKSKLSSAGDVTVSGGGTLNLDRDAGNSLTGDWYVSGGSTLSTNNRTNQGKQTSDPVFGSGKIYLDSSTLKTCTNETGNGSAYEVRISNDLVVSGDCKLTSTDATEMFLYGNISGSGSLSESVTYSLRLYGDNSAYTGNWKITGDWVWTTNDSAAKGSDWAGDGDYSFGSGQIEITSGGLATTKTNAYVWNDMKISGGTNLIKGGTTTTFTGDLTGGGALNLNTTSTATINFRGDNSAFTGAINITGRTVTTDNESAEKVNGGDSRLGQGQITIAASGTAYGALKAAAATTYVHNNIKLNKVGEGFDPTQFQPFLTESGQTLILTGALTGNADVYKTDAGTLTLNGDGSAYTGDWYIKGGKVVTNNKSSSASTVGDKKADQRFGTGTIYVENATISTAPSGTNYIFNPINVTGEVKFDLTGGHELYLMGDLTGDGTIRNAGGYTFGLRGNNSEFTGNFIISGDYVNTDNAVKSTDGKDPRFGQGILFFNGTGISTGANNQTRYVANDIIVLNGNSKFWRGNFHLTGVLTVNNNVGFRDVAALFIENKLQGTAALALPVTISDGGMLSPGYTGVVDINCNPIADQPLGTLTFSNTLTLAPGSIVSLDVKSATQYDKIALSSDELDVSGTTINLNFLEDFDPTDMNLDYVLQFAGTTTKLTGVETARLRYDVSQLPETAQWMRFILTPEGVQVVDANYVPEPAAWVLLLLGAGFFGIYARSGKNKNN